MKVASFVYILYLQCLVAWETMLVGKGKRFYGILSGRVGEKLRT